MRWAGFSAQMLMRSTELSATTKLSAEHETPPIANVLLSAALILVVNVFQVDPYFVFFIKQSLQFEFS